MISTTLHTYEQRCNGRCAGLCWCDDTATEVTVTGTVNGDDAETVVLVSATVDGRPVRLTAAEVNTACERLWEAHEEVETKRAADVVAKTWAEFTKLEAV